MVSGAVNLAFEGVTEADKSIARNALLTAAGRKADAEKDFSATGVNWAELESRMEDAGESFTAGITATGIMGLPTGLVRLPASIREAKSIVRNAAEQIVTASSPEEAAERAAASEAAKYVKHEELRAFAGEPCAAARPAGPEVAPCMKNALRPTEKYPALCAASGAVKVSFSFKAALFPPSHPANPPQPQRNPLYRQPLQRHLEMTTGEGCPHTIAWNF
jgi:hypothetical protein